MQTIPCGPPMGSDWSFPLATRGHRMGRESLLSIFQRNSDRAGKRQLLNVRSFDFERRLWRSSEGSKGS
jgi:hypothetical protein